MEVFSAFVNLIPVSLVQSLIYAFVALGIMIPFRVLSFPDLTSEGSLPLGACVCAAALVAGHHPVSALLLAMLAGFAAGCVTALIHQKVRINTLLCGILVLTALYSINIRIMGQPNTPLFAYPTVFELALGDHKGDSWYQIALLGVLVLLLCVLLWWALRTQIGMAMRAVGVNIPMARAQGINVAVHTVCGLGLGNAFAALAGGLLAQNQGFADVNVGFGVLINGLAALILGETLIGTRSVWRQLLAPVVGAILYYQVISFALAVGMRPSDLKLATAVFVLLTLAIPAMRGKASTLRVRE
ncbi:MAG: ABC transporter permease [Burkholderiales bacterium]|nr:ABC transporter permease [Burkholderiales bacterium]